jgi:DNA oxidative demethylase
MLDLFDAPLISGLDLRDEFVTPAEEEQLIARIAEVELTPFQFRGFEGKRLTHSFGWRYDFEDQSFTEAQPIPDWLQPLKTRAETFAGLPADSLMHALIIRYDPGAGIGWHKDRPVFEHVVGISLGAPTMMTFRRREGSRFKRIKVPLEPRSAYHLSGERSLSDLGRRRRGLR